MALGLQPRPAEKRHPRGAGDGVANPVRQKRLNYGLVMGIGLPAGLSLCAEGSEFEAYFNCQFPTSALTPLPSGCPSAPKE
jgi:hypothetical protein